MEKRMLINYLGAKIHQIRCHRQLTIKYVARFAKISKTTLKSLEDCRYSSIPSYHVLKKIADALGIQRKRLVYPVTQETGRRIHALRVLHHQSQITLANNIHKSSKAISRWECGHGLVNGDCISYLATYFHVRPSYLMCQTDDKYTKQANSKATHNKTISLFSCNTKSKSKSHVINPLCFSLNDAVDKHIPVIYHGVSLSEAHWNICRKLIKDWCQHEIN